MRLSGGDIDGGDRYEAADSRHRVIRREVPLTNSTPKLAAPAARNDGCSVGPNCNSAFERIENIGLKLIGIIGVMFFTFPEDARWNDERQAVEFSVEVGEYHGVVRLPRRVFQRLLPERPTPERCLEAYHLQRTRFERAAERKLRRRQLTDDGNVEISGRDLREGDGSQHGPSSRDIGRATPSRAT